MARNLLAPFVGQLSAALAAEERSMKDTIAMAANGSADQRATLAFVTPSYFGDFEQCKLLCESIAKYCEDEYRHYLLIDRRDVPLFSTLETARTTVVAKEDLLPSWVARWRLPLPKKNRFVRLSLKSRPIRGWIAQQMCKLAMVEQLEHEHVIMVDSDVVLVKPFSVASLLQNGLSPLYAKPNAIWSDEMSHGRHLDWQRVSERMLGLPEAPEPLVDFITPFNFWRPDNVRALRSRIETTTSMDWMVAVARADTFCEPVAYGCMALDEGADAIGHRLIDMPLCYSYWTPERISNDEMAEFLSAMPETAYAVNIQSTAKMPIESYAFLVRDGAPTTAVRTAGA